jgi:hypothetical protein
LPLESKISLASTDTISVIFLLPLGVVARK